MKYLMDQITHNNVPKSCEPFAAPIPKMRLERNRQRDLEVNTYLECLNWKVIRFWSLEIEKRLEDCIVIIQQQIALLQKQG